MVSHYSSTINACEVPVARRILFAKGGRAVENIPPTLNALKQHIKQSVFQAIKWSQCLIKDPSSSLADPRQWDWQETELGYSPVWTTLPKASEACRVLPSALQPWLHLRV